MSKKRKRRAKRGQQRRRSTWVLPAILAAAVVFTAGVIWLANRASDPARKAVVVPTRIARSYVDDKALGPADAPVLMEEYSDFQ